MFELSIKRWYIEIKMSFILDKIESFICSWMQIMLKRNASSATAELLFHF